MAPAPEPPAILRLEARGLTLERGPKRLIEGLDFALDQGTLLRIDGANGSGKTTLLRCIAGLGEPASGTLHWRGRTLKSSREMAADSIYIGHHAGLSGDLNPLENLAFFSALSAASPGATPLEALERLDAKHLAARPVRLLSAGQRQRVSLSRLVLFKAPLWLLDEPFTALDRHARPRVEALIDDHLAAGGAAIMATHQATNSRGSLRTLDLSATR